MTFGNCWIAALYVKGQYDSVQTVMQFKAETFSSRSQNLDGGKKLHGKSLFYESSGFVGSHLLKSSFGEEVVVARLVAP